VFVQILELFPEQFNIIYYDMDLKILLIFIGITILKRILVENAELY
jgi:hypothetical protein